LRGRLKSFADPAGHLTEVAYDGSGRPALIARSATAGGVTTSESFVYLYDGAGRVASVTLTRQVGAAVSIVRSAEDQDYVTGDAHGRDGDLKLVEVYDENAVLIDTTYYRYYIADGAGAYAGGLKMAF